MAFIRLDQQEIYAQVDAEVYAQLLETARNIYLVFQDYCVASADNSLFLT